MTHAVIMFGCCQAATEALQRDLATARRDMASTKQIAIDAAEWLEKARTERDTAIRDLAASQREADRLRHGEAIESDFICPDALALAEVRRELGEVREQVQALRLALQVCADCGCCAKRDQCKAAALKGTP